MSVKVYVPHEDSLHVESMSLKDFDSCVCASYATDTGKPWNYSVSLYFV